VDFQLGEQQLNIDWALCECMKTTNLEGIKDVMVCYDVMCQYHRNLMLRVSKSSKLTLPDTIRIISAIGLFHVHGHQEKCLYQFATTYIPGVGHIDGEIIETLWATLNDISRSTRTATLAHRTEVLDDHMGDSNWKKNINMGKSL
jgi:Kyakuja-Dileera-Zisupton transposase